MSKKIVVILGPTSSGKTSLSVSLCKRLGGEIISADSRQVVKNMDVGTGKLPIQSHYPINKESTKWILDGINIWGYDLTEPNGYFSGVDWAVFALNKAKELLEKGNRVFLVGGTGFYIDLFTARVLPAHVEPDLNLREDLQKLTLIQLQNRLTTLSPTRMEIIDQNNPIRLIRAIEAELCQKKNSTPLPYLQDTEYKFIGLTAPRETLYKAVDSWTDIIWENGLVEEVQNLISLGYSDSAKLSGLVYKQVHEYLSSTLSREDAIQKTKYSLHAYIRRQQTYFKKMPNINWFDITHDDYKERIYTLVNG